MTLLYSLLQSGANSSKLVFKVFIFLVFVSISSTIKRVRKIFRDPGRYFRILYFGKLVSESISNILGLLIHSSITGCKKDIIEILTVIIDSGKFNEEKYQDLVIKTLEYFEDKEFRLFCL